MFTSLQLFLWVQIESSLTSCILDSICLITPNSWIAFFYYYPRLCLMMRSICEITRTSSGKITFTAFCLLCVGFISAKQISTRNENVCYVNTFNLMWMKRYEIAAKHKPCTYVRVRHCREKSWSGKLHVGAARGVGSTGGSTTQLVWVWLALVDARGKPRPKRRTNKRRPMQTLWRESKHTNVYDRNTEWLLNLTSTLYHHKIDIIIFL